MNTFEMKGAEPSCTVPYVTFTFEFPPGALHAFLVLTCTSIIMLLLLSCWCLCSFLSSCSAAIPIHSLKLRVLP